MCYNKNYQSGIEQRKRRVMKLANSTNNKTGKAGGRSGGSRTAGASTKKNLNRQQIAFRREIYAGVCALLALLCLLSLFHVKGFLLKWIEKIVAGAIGSGFVLAPFCLFWAAGLFFLKRKGKVRLRATCALLLPVLWGAAAHVFNCVQEFSLTAKGIADLAVTGAARESGGLLSGSLALLFSSLVSDAGAILFFFFGGLACLMAASNTTFAMLFDRVKGLPPEEEDETPIRPKKKAERLPKEELADGQPPLDEERARRVAQMTQPAKQPILGGLFGGRRKNIDIPIGPMERQEYPKGEPIQLSPPNVRTPDQVIEGGRPAEKQPPKPSLNVAEPVKRDISPEPVLPELPKAAPVISPAVLRAQQYAAQKAAELGRDRQPEEERLAPAPLDPLTPPQKIVPNRPELQESQTIPQPEKEPISLSRLPWDEDQEAPFAPEQPASIAASPASVVSPALLRRQPPEAPPKAQEPEELQPEIAAAAALAAAQSPRESLGQEGPEWDAPDLEIASQSKQALEEALDRAPKDVYLYPPVSLLSKSAATPTDYSQELAENSARLVDTLKSFGVEATLVDITRGPNVTRYELQLKRGTKFSRVNNLSDDIALSLGAASVRITMIPDKLAVGIEAPNKVSETVPIRDLIDSPEFGDSKSKISFCVGKDITGHNVIGDIKKMPHMLIAGTTGSGKSVCINSLLVSLIYKATPEEVRLIMVDPKMVELGGYNGIPHLLIPVVTDPRKAAGALNWAVSEMERRYKLLSEVNVRDLESYNNLMEDQGGEKLPQIVIVIDELADLMFVAANDVEQSIVRVAQKARAAGMHLVIATQRPSADVITGIMKANIPSRISFAVASQIESRIILDTPGAEKLLGRGDMLYAPLGAPKPLRVQGCFITTAEIESVVEFVKKTSKADYSQEVMDQIERQAEGADNGADLGGGEEAEDEMLPRAIEVVVEMGQASTSMLQRRLKLGYSRASRLVDEMEARGIVGPFEGSKPRQVLITRDEWREMMLRRQD